MKKLLFTVIASSLALTSVAQLPQVAFTSLSEKSSPITELINQKEAEPACDVEITNLLKGYNINQNQAEQANTSDRYVRLDSIVADSYNVVLENWMRMYTYNFFTEESDDKKETFYAVWDYGTGQWQKYTQVRWEFDKNGRPAYYLSIPGGISENGLDTRYKKESFYSYSDELTEIETIEYWRMDSSADYIPTKKEKRVLLNDDKLLLSLTSQWSNSAAEWIFVNKKEYEYDENGFSSLNAEYSWSAFGNDWVGTIKKEYENNNNGKPRLEIKYVWGFNAMQWQAQVKTEFDYDDLGFITEHIVSWWDVNEENWVVNTKESSVFDAAGNLVSRINFHWDNENNSWINGVKVEFGYDENRNQNLSGTYLWSEEKNDWVGQSQTTRIFDLLNNLSFKTDYSWESTTDSWIYFSMEKPEYNEYGHIILASYYEWDNENKEWKFIHDINSWEYEYDAGDKMTSKIKSQWKAYEQIMERTVKFEYEYDEQDRQIMMQQFAWDPEMNKWKPYLRKIIGYDEAGRSNLDTDYLWNFSLNDWKMQREYRWAYDDNSRLIMNSNLSLYGENFYSGSKSEVLYNDYGRTQMRADYFWDMNINAWAGSSKKEYTYYDENLTYREVNFRWDAAEEDWQYYNRRTWYYTFDNVKVADDDVIAENGLKLYPNPADGHIRINLAFHGMPAKLELFTMGGQKILSQTVINDEPVSINHLTQGVYLYRVTQDQKLYTGKIIKR